MLSLYSSNSQKKAISNIIIFAFFLLCFFIPINANDNNQIIPPEILSLKAPDIFKVKFETTKGEFKIKIERKNSPLAVDRFYQLVKANYFTNIPVYRGVKNFVIQFGTLDTNIDNVWSSHLLIDEPVIMSNKEGTLSFARAGKNSRGSQLFINLKDNARLDTVSYGETLGFPAFGEVIDGMDIVRSIFTGYNDEPRMNLDSTISDINKYLKDRFPNLDYINKVYIISE